MTDTRIDPIALTEKLAEVSEAWAHAKAKARLFEERKKIVLGQITKRLMVVMDSHAAAEKAAYASDEYSRFVDEWADAELKADLAKVAMEKHQTLIDLLRSVNSYNREAMRNIGVVP